MKQIDIIYLRQGRTTGARRRFGVMQWLKHLRTPLTKKRGILLGASVVTGFVFVFNLPSIPGEIAAWEPWLHWIRHHHLTVLIPALVVWIAVTMWLVVEIRTHPVARSANHETDKTPRVVSGTQGRLAADIGDIAAGPDRASTLMRAKVTATPPRPSYIVQAQALLARGGELLAELAELRTPVDPHMAKYEPWRAASKPISLAVRYSVLSGPEKTNRWLADVSRFVAENARTWDSALYPQAVRSLEAELSAINQGVRVLREIAAGVLIQQPLNQ